jgi:hypothetical protein
VRRNQVRGLRHRFHVPMPLAPSLFCPSSPTLPVQRYSHLSRHIMQSPCVKNRLSATNENVVDGDVDWKIEVSLTVFVKLSNLV